VIQSDAALTCVSKSSAVSEMAVLSSKGTSIYRTILYHSVLKQFEHCVFTNRNTVFGKSLLKSNLSMSTITC